MPGGSTAAATGGRRTRDRRGTRRRLRQIDTGRRRRQTVGEVGRASVDELAVWTACDRRQRGTVVAEGAGATRTVRAEAARATAGGEAGGDGEGISLTSVTKNAPHKSTVIVSSTAVYKMRPHYRNSWKSTEVVCKLLPH